MISSPIRRLMGAAGVLSLIASAVVVGSVIVPARTLALPGASESTVVMIDPARVVDTRVDVGLDGRVVAGQARQLLVAGAVDTYLDATSETVVKEVVPVGATGVLLNVTAVLPTAPGFLSIRTGTATGVPATAGLNFESGAVIANGITVGLPATGVNAGHIDLYYGTPTAGAAMHVIVDVVGYTTSSGLIDLANRVSALESSVVASVQGTNGTNGTPGIPGAAGEQGIPGAAGSNGPVEGSACVAGGLDGTIKTSFNAVDGLMSVHCVRFGQVSTLAGINGIYGAVNGIGTEATFEDPVGVAVDGDGNVYVADIWNHLIRKITPEGVVSTLAGSAGDAGYVDANGTTARFNEPSGVAVDRDGNVYVADSGNQRIRKITPGGEVTTLAAGFSFPTGVAVDGDGYVYVADTYNDLIRKITPGGEVTTLAGDGVFDSDDGPGGTASFKLPQGVAVDGDGYVYVADTYNDLIRKITPGGEVTTLAAGFSFPTAVAVDGDGNVYVPVNNLIHKIAPDGDVTTFASGSNDARGLAVDGSGNVYVADTLSHRIRKITPDGEVTTLAGGFGSENGAYLDGVGTAASFKWPSGVAVDGSGNVYVADTDNYLIRKIWSPNLP